MANSSKLSGEIVIEYLEQHIKMPKKTLARLIYKENPKVYRDVEHVRALIRYYTGTNGCKCRKELSIKDFVLPQGTPDNKYSMPNSHIEEWAPYVIPESCKKVLLLPDIHIPWHDTNACNIAIEYGKKTKCDTVVLLGDFLDCYSVSSFQKDPRMRNMAQEIEACRHFLMALRKAFPKAKIIAVEGNHEFRIPRYGMRNAPEMFGTDFMQTLDDVLELDRLGIKWHYGKRPMYFGKLNVMHGHEFGGRSGGINPARNMFLKTKECCICGHWHRSSQYSGKTVRDRVLSSWTVGCLCDMHPDYMPINEWNLGFAVIERDEDDWFKVDNKRIIHGKIV